LWHGSFGAQIIYWKGLWFEIRTLRPRMLDLRQRVQTRYCNRYARTHLITSELENADI